MGGNVPSRGQVDENQHCLAPSLALGRAAIGILVITILGEVAGACFLVSSWMFVDGVSSELIVFVLPEAVCLQQRLRKYASQQTRRNVCLGAE